MREIPIISEILKCNNVICEVMIIYILYAYFRIQDVLELIAQKENNFTLTNIENI